MELFDGLDFKACYEQVSHFKELKRFLEQKKTEINTCKSLQDLKSLHEEKNERITQINDLVKRFGSTLRDEFDEFNEAFDTKLIALYELEEGEYKTAIGTCLKLLDAQFTQETDFNLEPVINSLKQLKANWVLQ